MTAYDPTPRAGEPEPVGVVCFWLLGAVAGAAWKKKLAGSALREDKKHKKIVLLLLFFRQNHKFLWLKKQFF